MSSATVQAENPYPGLRPFQADESHLFFGRDEQRTELLNRLHRSRFLAVVGASGSGKSSLVRAGLLPDLYGGFMVDGSSHWRVVDTRPGGDPVGRLAEALDRDLLVDDEDDSFTEATLRNSSRGLVEVVEEARLRPGEKVLLLVDQFEELFRFMETSEGKRAADDATGFVTRLLSAVNQDEVPIYVVITMRSDFLGDCARFKGLPEVINDGQYLIPRLNREQRKEAVVGPARIAGVELSSTLVNKVLNDVGDTPDQLPILQHALMRTFDRWKDQNPDSATIDLADYENVGGMEKALHNHAQAVLDGLTDNVDQETGARRVRIAEKMLKCLTDVGKAGRKVRRLATLKEIAGVADASTDEIIFVVDAFRAPGNAFLMPPISEKLTTASYIDISHESFMRNWDVLDQWIDEESTSAETYRLLAQRAVLHRDGEEDLLGRQALRAANDWYEDQQPNEAWASRYDTAYQSTISFLDESNTAVNRLVFERDRSTKIRRTLVTVAFVWTITALISVVLQAGSEAENDQMKKFDQAIISYPNEGNSNRQLMNFLEDRESLSEDETDIESERNNSSRLHDSLYSRGSLDHASIAKRFKEADRDGVTLTSLNDHDTNLLNIYRALASGEDGSELDNLKPVLIDLRNPGGCAPRDAGTNNPTTQHNFWCSVHGAVADRAIYRVLQSNLTKILEQDLEGLDPQEVEALKSRLENLNEIGATQIIPAKGSRWLPHIQRALNLQQRVFEQSVRALQTDLSPRRIHAIKNEMNILKYGVQKFTIWQIPDNQTLHNAIDIAKNLNILTLLMVLWFIWAWRRRFRSRQGIVEHEDVSILRLGLACLLDHIIAAVTGLTLGILVAGVVAVPVVLIGDSFEIGSVGIESTESIFGMMEPVAWIVGILSMFAYLMVRHAITFRYPRSIGMIICECRLSVDTFTLKQSLKRNWIFLIAPLILVIINYVFIFTVAETEIRDTNVLDSAAYTNAAVGLALLLNLLTLGLFEKFCTKRSGVRTIDSRTVLTPYSEEEFADDHRT